MDGKNENRNRTPSRNVGVVKVSKKLARGYHSGLGRIQAQS